MKRERINAPPGKFVQERRADNRKTALEYLARVRAGECVPYANRAIARIIRRGYAGDDVKSEFQSLVNAKKTASVTARNDRIERYLALIERGKPLSCDGVPEFSLRQGRASSQQLRRFNDEIATRALTRHRTIREFLSFLAAHRTSKLSGKKHPGYLLLKSEPPDSPLSLAYVALKSELASADRDEMAATVSGYEETGRISDIRHINRVTKYPEIYPDLHARYRAAQKRHILLRDSVPPEIKKQRSVHAYRQRRAHRNLLSIAATLKNRLDE